MMKGGLRDPFFYPLQSCSLGTEEPTSSRKFTANKPDETLRVCEKIRSWFDTLTTNGMV